MSIQTTRIRGIEVDGLLGFLERHRQHLRPDPSHYARGRAGFWFRREPHLGRHGHVLPGVPCDDAAWGAMQAQTQWAFDWCLVTYSGDATPAGITPHRDAAFTGNEARGLNVSGFCDFEIWEGRNDEPSTLLRLHPGDLTIFDCKRLHAATPGPGRWCVNTWRSKPQGDLFT